MNKPGTQLEQLCATGRQEIVLVAPFIKVGVLMRLLTQINTEVQVCCVTRWRPEEVVAGVSDLEIWPLLRERSHTELRLRFDLHAKYYRVDHHCLIGSANLTDAALGWSPQSNLELLIAMPATEIALFSFETNLFDYSTPVDDDLFNQMRQAVQLLREQGAHIIPRISETQQSYRVDDTEVAMSDQVWLPTLRHPEDLYLAYAGRYDELTTTARQTAMIDLCNLPVIAGLSRAAFDASIGVLLLQKPLIRRVDMFLVTPQRFGAVRDLIATLPCASLPDFDAGYAWQTLMRWLFYFLPGRYTHVPSRHSEVIRRIA